MHSSIRLMLKSGSWIFGNKEWLGALAALATLGWTVIVYTEESSARKFEQQSKAWAAINEHATRIEEALPKDAGSSSLDCPRIRHTNTGHVTAIEFLAQQRVSLSGIGLPCSEFGGIQAANANFSGATLSVSNFVTANLQNADLRHGDFSRSNFSWANLRGAKLADASFRNAILTDTDFTDAEPEDKGSGLIADFSGACYFGGGQGTLHRPKGLPASINISDDCSKKNQEMAKK